MFKTKIKSESGYTLIEMLVVIAIMTLLIVMAIPFDLSYRKKAEIKQSTKELRALFWEAQARSLAPSSKDAKSYEIYLAPSATSTGGLVFDLYECLAAPPCNPIPKSRVALGANIFIKDVLLDSVSMGAATTRISFLVGNGRTAGQISFSPVATSADILIGSLSDTTLKYDIIVDSATNSITYK